MFILRVSRASVLLHATGTSGLVPPLLTRLVDEAPRCETLHLIFVSVAASKIHCWSNGLMYRHVNNDARQTYTPPSA